MSVRTTWDRDSGCYVEPGTRPEDVAKAKAFAGSLACDGFRFVVVKVSGEWFEVEGTAQVRHPTTDHIRQYVWNYQLAFIPFDRTPEGILRDGLSRWFGEQRDSFVAEMRERARAETEQLAGEVG